MTNAVDDIEVLEVPSYRPAKIPLTVDHVSALLRRNYNQSEIARRSGVTVQAVNQFIQRNYEVLHSLVDNTDFILSQKLKGKAAMIIESIEIADVQKANLLQKATAFGILTDKYRLLSGQSTENVAVDGILRNIHSNLFNNKPADGNKKRKAIDNK